MGKNSRFGGSWGEGGIVGYRAVRRPVTANKQGKDMAYSGGIISKPVRKIDIAQALGVASRDVGTLCTSDKINMWAKNKPVRFHSFAPIIDAQRASVNYGLNVPYYLYNVFFDNSHLWEYLRPRGTSVSPIEQYRLRDFDGYKVDAESPFVRLYMDEYVYKNKVTNMSFNYYGGDELPLSSFKVPDTLSSGSPKSPLSQFTFCFLMKLGSDYYIWSTGKTPATIVGQETASVPISISSMHPERASAKIAVVLCKDSTLVARQWKSVSTGQLTSYSIIPLGFTDSIISDYTGEVRTFQSFSSPGAIIQVTHTPSTGHVYYGFTMAFSCTEINVGSPTSAYNFKGTMRIVRNGVTVQTKDFVSEDIVAQYHAGTLRYLFLFRNGEEVRTTPLLSQTGDELWVDISYVHDGISELQTSANVADL